MKFIELRPMLSTNNFLETIEFYTKQLGFRCDVKDENTGWAAVSRDWIQIMISVPNAHTNFTKANFTGSIYITVDENIDDLWNELKDKSELCYAIETFDYGMREFALYDNNGYLLQFGQQVS